MSNKIFFLCMLNGMSVFVIVTYAGYLIVELLKGNVRLSSAFNLLILSFLTASTILSTVDAIKRRRQKK